MYAIHHVVAGGRGERRLLALASKERLVRILEKMLDEDEFFVCSRLACRELAEERWREIDYKALGINQTYVGCERVRTFPGADI
jgi:hypothetical protein